MTISLLSSGALDDLSISKTQIGWTSSEMTKTDDRDREPVLSEGYDWSFEAHRRRQTRRGLEMTPAERLRWLEETMEELRQVQGRAAAADRR